MIRTAMVGLGKMGLSHLAIVRAHPGIDLVAGCDATARLKLHTETQHIPIIVLSAHAMPNARHQALAAGGDDFDTKPVQFDRHIEKMDTLLVKP